MYEAEDAWYARDFARARDCFQRVLPMRPTHQAANERMAELCFIDGQQLEGLGHFDQLVQPPEFPIIDFRAAAACLITGRFEQGADLAKRFLDRTAGDDVLDGPRERALLAVDRVAGLTQVVTTPPIRSSAALRITDRSDVARRRP